MDIKGETVLDMEDEVDEMETCWVPFDNIVSSVWKDAVQVVVVGIHNPTRTPRAHAVTIYGMLPAYRAI